MYSLLKRREKKEENCFLSLLFQFLPSFWKNPASKSASSVRCNELCVPASWAARPTRSTALSKPSLFRSFPVMTSERASRANASSQSVQSARLSSRSP